MLPAEFELPDEWWNEAGMAGFSPGGRAYRSAADARLVSLRTIEPPFRFPERPLDWRGFSHERLVRVLSGIATDAEIEPVPVVELLPTDFPRRPFQYRVCDGLHRFYASVAAGFECLPVVIVGESGANAGYRTAMRPTGSPRRRDP
jgi:hypothetical protein